MKNARCQNGTLRRKNRARFKAMDSPCGICRGALGRIHYDEPSDPKHPLSFVIDEIRPISRYKEFGYDSPRDAAEDWNNLQAAHYYCNACKSNKTNFFIKKNDRDVLFIENEEKKINVLDGEW